MGLRADVVRTGGGDVDGENELWKFVHTWQRDGDSWQIIGGNVWPPPMGFRTLAVMTWTREPRVPGF